VDGSPALGSRGSTGGAPELRDELLCSGLGLAARRNLKRMARYFAFISYSHSDAGTARWLHRALESYRLPRAVHREPESVGLRSRLSPVFLDRAELATSAELGAEVQRALEESDNLIVVCSPASARSRWVNEEIRRFRALGRAERIFCVVAPVDAARDQDGVVFPPALAEPAAAGGPPRRAEPLAADLRASGDGRRDGFLKLVAGLLGLRFDQLRRREQARRQRRLIALTAASLTASAVLAGLAFFALLQRQEADRQRSIAEQRSLTAERTTSFLQSLFEVSDPSKALGNTITAREVLDRGARRIAEGLQDEPEVRATLITTLGSVYASLGLYRQADELLDKPSDLQASNRAAAADIPAKLELIGCALEPSNARNAGGFAFREAELALLARREHDRWCESLRTRGWEYGEGVKDELRKRHPRLVAWDELPEAERSKDVASVRRLPSLLAEAGFRIRRAPPTRA
jgi:hypothetical protein